MTTPRSHRPAPRRGLAVRIAAVAGAVMLAFPGSSWAVPAWVSNLPYWQWYQIPNTALQSVQPNPPLPLSGSGNECKITCWNGATLKRQGSVYLIGAAGGHNGYFGNEVDALTLNTDTPHWVQLVASSPPSTWISNVEYYLDYRPAAVHTYWGTQFIDARNRMLIMPSTNYISPLVPDAPAGWPYVGDPGYLISFNMNTNQWVDARDPEIANVRYPGGGSYWAAMTVKHPVTEDVYYNRANGGWYRWTEATNTWVKLSNNTQNGNYRGAAIDPVRNRMLLVGSYEGTYGPEVRDLNGNLLSVTFSGLGTSALTVGNYPGVVYDEANDTYLVFHNTGSAIDMLRVNASTFAVDRPALTGPLPAPRENGIQNAVQYVPELGGVVIANDYFGNVFFMRTAPAAPDTTPPASPSGLHVK